MNLIRFTKLDAYLLWCLSWRTKSVAAWIGVYTYVLRDAVPNYIEMTRCVDRAVQAGVISYPQGGEFAVNMEWFNKLPPDVRAWFEQRELGMVEFSDWLPTIEWPIVEYRRYCLPYEAHIKAIGIQPQRPLKPEDLG